MLNLKRIQDFVSMLFYQHGLLCATYPFAYIFGVITINLFMCYPLLKLPLRGNAPLQFITPTHGYSVPPAATMLEELSNDGNAKRPRWYFGSPVAYIQQIVVKTAIMPWDSSRLINSDLLRSSLFTAFELLEHIDNYQLQNNMSQAISLADVCLRVAEVVSDEKVDGLLPEYNCLALSPVRFWKQDKQRFLADQDLIGTMFKKHGMLFDAPPSVRDILFGVPWVKKYHLSRRRRVISYAVTIALREYNHLFLTGLQQKLMTLYPQSFASNVSQIEHLVHIHYHGHNFIVEYTPLIFAYIVLFLYLYFSVRKIEMVKSKWGLALSAMVTVVASLLMSVSLCLFFGLTPSLSGSEIFPYLVVIIGLENNLVITKSVVTTPVHLEVKLRIAQGLQKEGWYIFKNLVTELLVLAFGFLTFVPAIQEFCLFAVLALGSDFFLQMFFFATVLSVDIRRMELSDLHRPSMHEAIRFDSIEFRGQGDVHCPVMGRLYPPATQSEMNGSLKPMQPLQLDAGLSLKPVPPPTPSPASSLEICDDFFYMDLDDERLPRRMRLLHFWARYRILQRGIMICVLIWIFLIVFKTGLVEELDEINPIYLNKDLDMLSPNSFTSPLEHQKSGDNVSEFSSVFFGVTTIGKSPKEEPNRSSLGLPNVFHESSEQWRYLSSNHWLTLLSYYNISLSGRYLTILPSFHLSIGVSPDEAISIRHPSETRIDPPQHSPSWDPTGQFTIEPNQLTSLIQRLVRYPRTKTEFVITILLCVASFFLFVFIVLSMYKCMCSRNYAKWRSSWQRRLRKANQYYKQIRESVPLVLNGHIQEVECIITDGQRIISSCLGGEIRVWDFGSGECLVAIDRAKVAARRQAALFQSGRRHSSSQSDGTDQPSIEASTSCPSAISIPFGRSHHPQTSLSSSFGSDDLQPVDQTRHHSRHRSVDFALASIIPDLTETIDTDFKNSARNRLEQDRSNSCSGAGEGSPNSGGDSSSKQRLLSNGYDFTHFESYFAEHRKMKQEEELYVLRKRGMKHRNSSSKDDFVGALPDNPDIDADVSDYPEAEDYSSGDHIYVEVPAAIWCLACDENIIVAGCGNGTVEFWDARSGSLRCTYQQNKSGVIGICLSNNRVTAARIDGTLDFLQYFSSLQGTGHVPPSMMHKSSLSGKCEDLPRTAFSEAVAHCVLSSSVKAHQQSINMISARGRHVVTASQDHTLKVYRIDDGLCLYTLHGHTAPVATLYIDTETPYGVVSGSADASVRVWDIQVGACIHKLSGHTGGVTSVVCSSAHVVSVGMDDRLCIWDRSKGHLIHCVQLEAGYCNTVAMLTKHLIITGGQGSLHLWDVHKGRLLRALSLGDHDASVFIRQLLVVNNSVVVCDFGPQLRVVQFTPVLEKDD